MLGLLLLLLPLSLASRSVLPTSLVAGLRVLLEFIDELAVAIGVGGLTVGIEVYEARHIVVLLVGLGNAERCRGSFTSSLLPTTSSPSSATLSAFSSSCNSHSDHVGRLLFFWSGFPLCTAVPPSLSWNGCCRQGAASIVVGSCELTSQLDHLIQVKLVIVLQALQLMSEQRAPFQPIDEGGHGGLSMHSCAGILHVQPAGEVGTRCLFFLLHTPL